MTKKLKLESKRGQKRNREVDDSNNLFEPRTKQTKLSLCAVGKDCLMQIASFFTKEESDEIVSYPKFGNKCRQALKEYFKFGLGHNYMYIFNHTPVNPMNLLKFNDNIVIRANLQKTQRICKALFSCSHIIKTKKVVQVCHPDIVQEYEDRNNDKMEIKLVSPIHLKTKNARDFYVYTYTKLDEIQNFGKIRNLIVEFNVNSHILLECSKLEIEQVVFQWPELYDYETISLFHKTQICVYTYPNEQLPQVLNEIIDKMSQTQIRICWKQKLGNLSPQHKKFLFHLLGKTEKKENIKVQMFVNMNIFERNNRTWCQLMNTRKQWLNHYKKWNIQPIQDKFEDCLFTLKFEPPKSRSQKDPKK